MQEKLPVALGIMVLDPGLVVGVDVRADEPRLALAHVRIGLLEAHAAIRSDFTSLPVSTIPASKRSRKW